MIIMMLWLLVVAFFWDLPRFALIPSAPFRGASATDDAAPVTSTMILLDADFPSDEPVRDLSADHRIGTGEQP